MTDKYQFWHPSSHNLMQRSDGIKEPAK